MLVDAGLTLPKDVLLDNRFRGMSAERIYNVLEEEEQNQSSSSDADTESQDDSGESGGDSTPEFNNSDKNNDGTPTMPQTPGGIGQVLDAPEPENGEADTVAEQARDWLIAVEQAENVAKLAGKLPAGVTRNLEAAQAAGVDWRELLRRAWSETIPADYSWTRPNRRHVWAGLYLPGITSEGVGEIAIVVDCSGSINARQLGYSRPRSAPSSPVNSHDSSMFCTSILKCRRLGPTRRPARKACSCWRRWNRPPY
jgi:hypothetical protein